MKAGIITKIGKNYGAVLQAYALKMTIDGLGVTAGIIKYTPNNSRKSYKICKFNWGPEGAVANIKALFHFKANSACTNRFYSFRNKYFNFIGEYNNYKEIEKDPPHCDIYISGSDQIWNPSISFDPAYYLTFVPKEMGRLTAYAASIGLNALPNQYVEEFKRRVSRFDFISVREPQAKTILDNLKISSVIAPDPTIMLRREQWDNIAVAPKINEPYILCYFVSVPENIAVQVNNIKNRIGIKVVNVMLSEESSSIGDIKIRDASPEEFVGLLKKASFVITSSYHGTIFALQYRIPFVTVLYQSTSSRIYSLLKAVHLDNRIVSATDDISQLVDNREKIYTRDVEDAINQYQAGGMAVLKQLLRL
jgi:polysaccharide pyruvyl transferase WcaK-like protein